MYHFDPPASVSVFSSIFVLKSRLITDSNKLFLNFLGRSKVQLLFIYISATCLNSIFRWDLSRWRWHQLLLPVPRSRCLLRCHCISWLIFWGLLMECQDWMCTFLAFMLWMVRSHLILDEGSHTEAGRFQKIVCWQLYQFHPTPTHQAEIRSDLWFCANAAKSLCIDEYRAEPHILMDHWLKPPQKWCCA